MFIFLILHPIKIATCYYNRYINFPVYSSIHNSPVLKQKGESQSRCYKKTKRAKFSKKTHVSYSLIRVRNVRFWENLACIVFLQHPFWDSIFCPIADELHYFINFTKFVIALGMFHKWLWMFWPIIYVIIKFRSSAKSTFSVISHKHIDMLWLSMCFMIKLRLTTNCCSAIPRWHVLHFSLTHFSPVPHFYTPWKRFQAV